MSQFLRLVCEDSSYPKSQGLEREEFVDLGKIYKRLGVPVPMCLKSNFIYAHKKLM